MNATPQKQAALENTDRYTLLRNWYLAGLRRRILRKIENAQLSPAALVAADQKAVEQLIMQADQSSPRTPANPQRRVPLLPALFAAALVPAAAQALTIYFGCPPATAIVIMAVCSACIAALLTHSVLLPIRRLARNATKLSGEDVPFHNDIADVELGLAQLAEKLSTASKREAAIADYALDFICALDSNGAFAAVSPSSAEFCGYANFELLGRNFRDFVADDTLETTGRFLDSARSTGGNTQFENQMRHKAGTVLDVQWQVEWSASAQLLFCIGHDITRDKELERMRAELISMVSHDLRTPIACIQGLLSLMQVGALGEMPAQALPKIEMAEANADRLIRLINDLLDAERMKAGKLPMNHEHIAIDVFVQAAIDAVTDLGTQRNVTLRTDIGNDGINGDSDRLVQVMINLLSNAIKFAPEGSTVEIVSETLKHWVEIRVVDHGRGIPSQYQTKIFEQFQQVATVDRIERKGSGLGLAICKMIVEQHGGTIGVRSVEDEGSTFWVRLPLAAQYQRLEEYGVSTQ